jgi:hypothetical protein
MSGSFFPFASLSGGHRELGLVVAVLLGFAFGFVLERAGFGRADKLAAQFYLRDMTVFKVMFSAIVTAMLGVVVASGLGLVELKALGESAASVTNLWSMVIGGLLLGAGFIISGYCPGTSAVSAASGNLDGVVTFVGVVAGSLLFAEAHPLLGKLQGLGSMGHLFLYQILDIPVPLLAIGITLLAIGAFLGAEKIERVMARRRGDDAPVALERFRPRRLAFSALGVTALLALVTVVLPRQPSAAVQRTPELVSQEQLAHRLLEEPWRLRILDLRDEAACKKERIPGAECAPARDLDKLGLAYTAGARDLVLVGNHTLRRLPVPAARYPGETLALEGGFPGWKSYALTRPQAPAPNATAAEREAYSFRAALHSAMTGRKPPPPAPAGKVKYTPGPRKKKGGGCS